MGVPIPLDFDGEVLEAAMEGEKPAREVAYASGV
jgi:hypothetical protein